MNKKLIGAALFAVAALLAVGYAVLGGGGGGDPIVGLIQAGRPAPVKAMGYVGSEKVPLLANPAMDKLLRDAGVTLDARKAGSIEMVTTDAILSQKPDFLWPGSQVAAEIAAQRGLAVKRREIVFNSPIVFYSWKPIAEALVTGGLAKPVANSAFAYTADAKALLEMVAGTATWADIGLSQLYGSMIIVPTDPARSNSGAQFAALAATLLGGGESDAALAKTRTIVRKAGYLENTSAVLFDQYLRNGMGDKPLIVGYENQIIEFAREKPELWGRLAGQPLHPVVLYPEPTVFSSHVMLALTEAGSRMIDAVLAPQAQCLAWRDHGFRSGLAGGECAQESPVKGLPEQVTSVVPMPPPRTVERILEAVAP